MNKQLISSDYDFSDMLIQEGMYRQSAKLYGLHTLPLSFIEKFAGNSVHAAEEVIKDFKKMTSNAISSLKVPFSNDSEIKMAMVLLFAASVPLIFVWATLLLS